VTLRLVAQYAQFCNVGGDPGQARHLFDTLREHCTRVGRPYEEITRSHYSTVVIGRDEAEVKAKQERLREFLPRNENGALIGTPQQHIDTFQAYAEAGVQYCIFRTPDWLDVEPVQLFADKVIPALANA
jgi:alkanesulfonate monooxygenase SsuD/methylene tetrahydromethanopterin reductase-like flavin-dependent oxidoreductase (luciferase family)